MPQDQSTLTLPGGFEGPGRARLLFAAKVKQRQYAVGFGRTGRLGGFEAKLALDSGVRTLYHVGGQFEQGDGLVASWAWTPRYPPTFLSI